MLGLCCRQPLEDGKVREYATWQSTTQLNHLGDSWEIALMEGGYIAEHVDTPNLNSLY